MSNVIRIKRRATGEAGAPASLANAELAFNEVGDVLYYGKGTGGAGGSASTIEAIAGKGAFLALSGEQTVAGVKLFTLPPRAAADASEGSDLVRKSQLDTLLTGVLSADSPALTGTPTAPTAAAGTNTTQIATTAFVAVALAGLVDSAPDALNTLNELAAALGDDPNFATTLTTAIGAKLAKASNLSDLTDVATARSNLGLGSMAVQAAGSVAITGGTIEGVTFDGGAF